MRAAEKALGEIRAEVERQGNDAAGTLLDAFERRARRAARQYPFVVAAAFLAGALAREGWRFLLG